LGNILVILLFKEKEEEEEEEETIKRKLVWEQSVTKLDLLSTPFLLGIQPTSFAKVLDLLAQNNHRLGEIQFTRLFGNDCMCVVG
jgi:hypothetical protein